MKTAIFVLHAFNPTRNSLFLGKITEFINPDNERVQYIIIEGKVLVKGRAGHVHARKASGGGGNGGSIPFIINFGSNWTWVVSFKIRPLYPRVK